MLLAVAAVLVLGAQSSRSDQDLERVLEGALRSASLFVDGRFEVDVTGGAARVYGSTRNLRGKWDALEIAAKLQGIVLIDDQIDVRSEGASDSVLVGLVRRRLANVPQLQSSRLAVSSSGSVVTLSGELADAQDRQRAREAVASIDGVAGVVDEMHSSWQPDSVIEDAVREVLGPRSLAGIAGRIEVAVHEGVVTLTGQVKTLFAQVQAERLAHSVNGVEGVNNQLAFAPRD